MSREDPEGVAMTSQGYADAAPGLCSIGVWVRNRIGAQRRHLGLADQYRSTLVGTDAGQERLGDSRKNINDRISKAHKAARQRRPGVTMRHVRRRDAWAICHLIRYCG